MLSELFLESMEPIPDTDCILVYQAEWAFSVYLLSLWSCDLYFPSWRPPDSLNLPVVSYSLVCLSLIFYSIIYFLFLEAGQKLKEIIFFTNKSQEKSGSLNIIKKESCFSKYRIIIFRNDAQQLYKERR